MAQQHGRFTVVTLNGSDLTVFSTTSNREKSADSHDVTVYGKNSHVFKGGLLNGVSSISGIYDNSITVGPRAIIDPIVGQNVTYIRYPEGLGSGKPKDTVNVLVGKYVETAPVADMVTWSLDLQFSDDLANTVQP